MKKHLVQISNDLNEKLQFIKKRRMLNNVNEVFVILVQEEYGKINKGIKDE